jgi:UDPglucose--hexose-1-phosphate uridylyltransferase
MPDLRKDPIIGRWVIIATERAKRPDAFRASHNGPDEGECPFCEGAESRTPPEIYAIRPNGSAQNSPGWDVRVVPSIKPMLRIEGEIGRQGKGIYDLMDGIGAHEVVIETNQHIDNMADLNEAQIARVFDTYIRRITDLEKDRRFRYVLVFKNYGWQAGGGRIRHSRSQLMATPINPKRVKEELTGAKRYYDYHERCIFCDMINQEIERKERLIMDVDGFVALVPFASRFPFEVWVLPKKHNCDFIDCDQDSLKSLANIFKQVLLKIKIGLDNPPYNFIIHTAPFRKFDSGKKAQSWKTIEYDYHWHIEIMPRLTRVAGFEWGTGFYICPLPPESAAEFLRGVRIEKDASVAA